MQGSRNDAEGKAEHSLLIMNVFSVVGGKTLFGVAGSFSGVHVEGSCYLYPSPHVETVQTQWF